jgi:two-component system, OmpR family, sensor histidine kinase TctE
VSTLAARLATGPGRSIAWRLTLLLTLLLTIAAAGTVVAALSYGQTAATRAFDRLLTGAALQIAERISVVEGETVIDIPLSAFGLLSLASEDRIFYRIIGPEGQTLTGDESFPLPDASARSDGPLLYDTAFSGEAVRAISMQRFLAERAVRGPITVIVAQTLRARSELANEIVARAVIGVVVAGGVTLALALLAMHLALSPLRRIERAILARDPKDLTPFSTATPREVEALVAAINRFMARLDRRVGAMQDFVADAAHQMRTPITALRAQTELAMEEDDPRKLKALQRRIRDRAIGVSRLTDQLLSHALVTHRADSATLERIDLRRVAVEAEREARRTGDGARRCLQPARGSPQPDHQRARPRQAAGPPARERHLRRQGTDRGRRSGCRNECSPTRTHRRALCPRRLQPAKRRAWPRHCRRSCRLSSGLDPHRHRGR